VSVLISGIIRNRKQAFRQLGNPGREYIVAVIAATAIVDNFQTPASFDLLSYNSLEDFSQSDRVIDILVPR
jgi:hypothetical protein